MRNRIINGLAIFALLAVAGPLAAQQATPKIAYINSQRIIQEAPGAQEARQTLEQETASYRAELQKLEEELQKLIQDYQQKEGMMTAEAKQQQQATIRQKQQELQQRAGQLEQQAGQRQAELVQPIMQRIEQVIDDIRQQENYAMIFDAAAGGMIAADPALDITDTVLARLQQTAQSQ